MRDKLIYVLGLVAILLLARDLYLITGFPAERNQGVIFKIIFFHYIIHYMRSSWIISNNIGPTQFT